jgi:hypothetical protein
MSRNFSTDLILMRISEKIAVQFFYYIKFLYKVLGVVLGISATFRIGRFCCCPHTLTDGICEEPPPLKHPEYKTIPGAPFK